MDIMKNIIETEQKETLVGIDIGSTTAKVVVVKDGDIVSLYDLEFEYQR